MSDAFMSESEEDGGDFSASEDEWLPGKSEGKRKRTRDDSDSSADLESPSGDEGRQHDRSRGKRHAVPKKGIPKKSKTNTQMSRGKKESTNKASNLTGARASRVESDSSGDEYLVDPTQLDLNSKFFDTAPPGASTSTDAAAPSFDCNAGLGKLSDSSDDEATEVGVDVQGDGDTGKRSTGGNKQLISKINEMSQAYVKFHDFTSTLEKAKEHLQTATKQQYQTQPGSAVDVSHLLALGETRQAGSSKSAAPAVAAKPTKATKNRRAAQKPVDSDSDWEEVEDGAELTTAAGSGNGKSVEITLRPEAAGAKKKKKCNEIDVEACIKRMINREKRDAQLVLHKMTIIMGIAHGNYTNEVLNEPRLLAIGNGLVPSERCYPKGRTTIGYFEQILAFFREIVDLKDRRMFVRSWKRLELGESLRLQLLSQMANCRRDYILLFIILLRSIGVQCRLVMSLQVVPKNVPAADLLKVVTAPASNGRKVQVDEDQMATAKRDHDYEPSRKAACSGKKRKVAAQTEIPQLDGADDAKPRTTRPRKAHLVEKAAPKATPEDAVSPVKTRKQRQERQETASRKKEPTKEEVEKVQRVSKERKQPAKRIASTAVKDESTCTPGTSKIMIRRDYNQTTTVASVQPSSSAIPKTAATANAAPGKKIVKIERFSASTRRALDRRVLSTDEESKSTPKGSAAAGAGKSSSYGVNLWVEVFAEEEERWLPVDVAGGKLQCAEQLVAQASTPMLYVLAWSNDGSIKDVSARYCAEYATVTQKLRIMQQWMDDTLLQFRGERTVRDTAEDRELNRILEERPLPKTIAEYKNHPYFALKRHLLKFEAIYPPDAPTLGFTASKEPVYARECVQTLHAREVWLKQARTVKLYETPYKIVSARPKYNRALGQMEPAQKPLELFGHWQTEEYEPPTAENGIVPRNAYGNVELFKPCMLPKKTVHLRLPCLNRICKKLRIDCAQAVTGFDFHGGSSHPVYDGFVVCEEYRDLVVDAWHQEQEAEEQRAREKYEKRVYGNWKRLIKGLLIRRKLQHKYNFDNLNQ